MMHMLLVSYDMISGAQDILAFKRPRVQMIPSPNDLATKRSVPKRLHPNVLALLKIIQITHPHSFKQQKNMLRLCLLGLEM